MLPPFPPPRALPDMVGLRRAGLSLRAAGDGDLPFLVALYASTRAAERLMVDWPDDAWARFVDTQFAAQHRDFATRYAADFLVIQDRGRPIGRLYLDRSGPVWRIVDIALLPEGQRKGRGTAVIRWVQRASRRANADTVELHVLHANPGAARLYARLGFVDAFTTVPTHRRMTWPVS